MEQSRFKSPIFVGAIIAWVITGLQMFGVFALIGLDAGAVQDWIIVGMNFAYQIFAAANNPLTKKKF